MEEELDCDMEDCPLSFIINWDRNKQVALSTCLMKQKMKQNSKCFERYQQFLKLSKVPTPSKLQHGWINEPVTRHSICRRAHGVTYLNTFNLEFHANCPCSIRVNRLGKQGWEAGPGCILCPYIQPPLAATTDRSVTCGTRVLFWNTGQGWLNPLIVVPTQALTQPEGICPSKRSTPCTGKNLPTTNQTKSPQTHR